MKEEKKVMELSDDKLDEVTGGVRYHTIQRGETLSMIAKRYSTTVEQICRWNNISNPNYIVAGKRIMVSNYIPMH